MIFESILISVNENVLVNGLAQILHGMGRLTTRNKDSKDILQLIYLFVVTED